MIQLLDSALNRITMYRLALYYVAGLVLVAFAFGFAGLVPNDSTALTFSTVMILGVCWVTNRLFATLLRVPANAESFYITAFILALVLPPTTAANLPGVAGLILASFVAIASKFVLAIRHRHIFNPVAIGIAVSALVLKSARDLVGWRQSAARAIRFDRWAHRRAQGAALRHGRCLSPR